MVAFWNEETHPTPVEQPEPSPILLGLREDGADSKTDIDSSSAELLLSAKKADLVILACFCITADPAMSLVLGIALGGLFISIEETVFIDFSASK